MQLLCPGIDPAWIVVMTGHIPARFIMSEGVVFFSFITFDSEVLSSNGWTDTSIMECFIAIVE